MLKSSNRPIQCKKEAKLDCYAINNAKFISRLKKIVNVGAGLVHEGGYCESKINSRVLCNETQYLNSDRPNPSFEVFLILKLRRRSENKVG